MTDSPPFFLLGMQRSGTTLLRLMLNKHPRLAVPDETGFIVAFDDKAYFESWYSGTLSKYGDLSIRENASALLDTISQFPFSAFANGETKLDKNAILSHPIQRYEDLINAIMTEFAKTSGKQRWGDKTPHYLADPDMLWRTFPGCQFIHLIRDVRAVVNSSKNVRWASGDLTAIASDWNYRNIICYKVGQVLGPMYYMLVSYEALIENTRSTLADICEFLGEDYSPGMLGYHRDARDQVRVGDLGHHETTMGPLKKEKIDSWMHELPEYDQVIVQTVAHRGMRIFGYEPLPLRKTLQSRVMNFYYRFLKR